MHETVVIAGFFPPPITGQGLATERLADLLATTNHVIRVNLRTEEERLDLRPVGRAFSKIRNYQRAGNRLKAVLKKHPSATVIWTAISPEPAGHFRDLLTILPAFQPGNKIYGVVHWGRFAKLFQSRITSPTASWLMKHLEALVFLNNDRANQCKDWVPAQKRFTIPNVLDEAVLCSDEEIRHKQQRAHSASTLNVLFLSHMIKEKGYLDALEAIYLAHQRGINVQATFAGQWLSDNDRIAFEQLLIDRHLTEVVTHLGPVSDRNQVKDLHLQSDVFILPSYMIEGQPLTILEAMNAGSPIITSNQGGMVDMITQNHEGYLVTPQDSAAIADALVNLVNKAHWQSLSVAARSRYLKDYHPDAVKKQWETLIFQQPTR